MFRDPFTSADVPGLSGPLQAAQAALDATKPGFFGSPIDIIKQNATVPSKPQVKSSTTTQPATSSFSQPASSGGGGGRTFNPGPSAAEIAENAERDRLRKSITDQIATAQGIYGSLFGQTKDIANERRGTLGEQFGEQRQQLTSDFANESDRIDAAFTSLGSGDSTFAGRAQQQAEEGLDRTLTEVGRLEDTDLAALGAFLAEQNATFTNDQNNLTRIGERVPLVENVNELREFDDTIAAAIGRARVAQAGANTQAGFRGELADATQGVSNLPQLRASLANILNSAVPDVVKERVGQELLRTSNLSEEEKLLALSEISSGSLLEEPIVTG